jgi:hypothetical protein
MSHNPGHIFHAIHKVIEERPRVHGKSAGLAFLIGLLFGAPGVGIYLRSWADFFICIGLFLFMLIVLYPTGPGEILGIPIALVFSGLYGYLRVDISRGY